MHPNRKNNPMPEDIKLFKALDKLIQSGDISSYKVAPLFRGYGYGCIEVHIQDWIGYIEWKGVKKLNGYYLSVNTQRRRRARLRMFKDSGLSCLLLNRTYGTMEIEVIIKRWINQEVK